MTGMVASSVCGRNSDSGNWAGWVHNRAVMECDPTCQPLSAIAMTQSEIIGPLQAQANLACCLETERILLLRRRTMVYTDQSLSSKRHSRCHTAAAVEMWMEVG